MQAATLSESERRERQFDILDLRVAGAILVSAVSSAPVSPMSSMRRIRSPSTIGSTRTANGFHLRILVGDLDDARRRAAEWCAEVAGRRVHGTTRKVPREVFEAIEKPTLLPPPLEAFDVPLWSDAKAHPNHHIQVGRALYSVPSRYIGKKLRVRVTARASSDSFAATELSSPYLGPATSTRRKPRYWLTVNSMNRLRVAAFSYNSRTASKFSQVYSRSSSPTRARSRVGPRCDNVGRTSCE